MRVCLFTDTYFPDTCKRSAYIKTLYDCLIARGNRVMIVVPDYKEETLFVEDGVMHCPARKLPSWRPRGCQLGLKKERFRRIKEFNPDILHAHDCSALGRFAMRAARKFDLPLLFTFHDPAETRPDDTPLPEPESKTPRALYHHAASRISSALRVRDLRRILSLADLITSPSGKAQSRIRDMRVNRKVEYFSDSVNADLFHPARITEDDKWSLRNRLGLSEGQKIILFAGVLSPDKNLDTLLSIWSRRLRDDDTLRFVIAGDGSEQSSLTETAEKLEIADRVVFAGALSHDDMAVLYSISTVYLSALVSETIPLSMLEAVTAGLPILLKYDSDNLHHIIERKNGFFFRSGKEMASLIRQFASISPEETERLREGVRSTAHEFGAENKMDALVDAYNRTISRHYNGHE